MTMKPTDIRYDNKKEKYIANKVDNETTYYIGVAKICPICNNYINGYSALSRKDNRTEICSNCGTLEALEIFKSSRKGLKMEKEKIEELVKMVDNISNKYTNEEFIIAVYLLIRFGKFTVENYVDSSDLEEIRKEIERHNSIFDEELNYNIDKILNNKEK